MSKKPKEIKKGLSYLARGEYSTVIRLLESKIPLFLENKEFYSILAKAFFYTGDFSGAKLYFDRGQKIHWDIESALYLAALGLKRRDFNSALRIWLDILDEDPENKMAKKGLSTLKKYSTMDELESFIHSKKVEALIPRKPIRLAPSTMISLSLIIFLATTVIFLFKTDVLETLLNKFAGSGYETEYTEREGQDSFQLTEFNKKYLDFSNQSYYSFTGAQIEEFFKIANDLFIQRKDNRVRTYLNLIKYSNASEGVKLKADKLESFLIEPNWANYNDTITFKDVENDPLQYEHCMIKWKGMISNYRIEDKKIHFKLLVGYESKSILEGVVGVELNENVKIQENQPIEVMGRVILQDQGFFIDALTVMQFVIKE